jgi:predicted Zn-dependent protease
MAVALSPASTRPRLLLAETYVALGRLDAAADQLLHVVRLEPDQPRHYRDLSRLYARSGRRDLAIVALRDGLAMAASLPPAQSRELLEELAAQYEQAGMTREAARERRRASELGAR